jgi:hypothetical protein
LEDSIGNFFVGLKLAEAWKGIWWED